MKEKMYANSIIVRCGDKARFKCSKYNFVFETEIKKKKKEQDEYVVVCVTVIHYKIPKVILIKLNNL